MPERWTAATEYADMWLDPADDPRDTGVELRGERPALLDYLRVYRLTLELKCAGLDAEQLARRSVPPSTMSLLGVVRHMAEVERYWFRRVLAADSETRLYCTSEDRDGDWNGAVASDEVVAQAWRDWRAEVDFAVAYVDATDDLATLGTMRDGSRLELREVLVHMVEEYARHCGHADLLRECIDGRVGQ